MLLEKELVRFREDLVGTKAIVENLSREIQTLYKEMGALGERFNSFEATNMTKKQNLQTNLFILLSSVCIIGISLVITFSYRIKKESDKNKKNIEVIFDFMNILPRKNPYIAGSPVLDKEMFYGRSEIIRTIIRGIHGNHYYILGERRSGKTSLLRRLTEEIKSLDDPKHDFCPIPLDFQSISEETLFKSLSGELLKSLSKLELKGFSDKIDSNFKQLAENAKSDDDFVYMFNHIYEAITRKHDKVVFFVLIIDEFSKINGFSISHKEQFRSVFMNTDNHLKLIAAGGCLEEWDRSSPFNFMNQLDISKLSPEDARKMILVPSKGIVDWEDKVVDYILDFSKRGPFEIQKICSSLVDYAFENRIFKIDESVLEDFLSQQKKEGVEYELHH